MDRPLEIRDFSGGITDNHIDSALNKYEEADNFNIEPVGQVAKLVKRPGSSRYSNASLGSLATDRIAYLKYFKDEMLMFYFQSGVVPKIYYRNGFSSFDIEATSGILRKPTTNSLLGSSNTLAISTTTWNDHLLVTEDYFTGTGVIKIYKSAGVYHCRTAGLPKPNKFSSSVLGTSVLSSGAGANNYLYAFVFKYTYQIDSVIFIDRSTPLLMDLVANVAEPNTTNIVWQFTPVVTTGLNYDTTNIKLELYRTDNNGTVFYYVGEIAATGGNITDNVSNANLVLNELLYTMDGSANNDSPPQAKYVHCTDTVALYANVVVRDGTGAYYPNRVYQSIPGDIDSVPFDFFTEVNDTIMGVSSHRSIPLIFCKNHVYRIDGLFDQFGRGGMFAVRISESAGCLANNSIVQTRMGVFWCGNDGLYWTDGYQIRKLTQDLNDRYFTWFNLAANSSDAAIKQTRIAGKYSERDERIYWVIPAAPTGNVATEVNKLAVMHLRFLTDSGAPLTTWSNGAHFSPTAIELIKTVNGNDVLVRATQRNLFQHLDTVSADIYIDYSVYAIPEKYVYIPYNFKSTTTSFGDNYSRKFNTRLVTVTKSKNGLTMLPTSIADFGKKTVNFKYINEPDTSDEYVLVEEQRRFPATTLRCSYRQIQYQPALVPVLLGYTGSLLSDGVKAIEIPGASAATWPSEPVGYVVYLNGGATPYTIYYRNTSKQVWVTPAPPVNGTITSFSVVGHPVDERLQLHAISIHWEPLGRTQNTYTQASDG